MIRKSLNLYRRNIVQAFVILGVLSIGLLIALMYAMPHFSSLISNSIGRVASSASNVVGEGFKSDRFYIKFYESLATLDWDNPIRTLKVLFEHNGLSNILKDSLKSVGVTSEQLGLIGETIHSVCHDAIITIQNMAMVVISIIGTSAIIGYLLVRLVIKMDATKNNNVFRFIGSLLLNLMIFVGVFTLCIISIYNLSKPVIYPVLVAIFLLLVLSTLLSSILMYRKKGTRFFELFNFKSIGGLLVSCLLVFLFSFAIIALINIFSDFIALFISIPLIIVTNIIIENISIKYVIEFEPKNKNKVSTNEPIVIESKESKEEIIDSLQKSTMEVDTSKGEETNE